MEMSAIRQFVSAVEEFLAFVEGEPLPPDEEVPAIVRHLKALLFRAESVFLHPAGFLADEEENTDEDVRMKAHTEQHQRVVSRFAHLPFQVYGEVFTPHEYNPDDPESKPIMGWLSDDLADIYDDLQKGYQLWLAGKEDDACFEWRILYFHWGHHATTALYALDTYRCENQLFNT